MKFFFGGSFLGQKPKILQKCGILSKIIRFERKTRRWKRLNPEIQNLLTDLKNIKNCGFYEQNTATVFFAKISKSAVDETIGRTKNCIEYDF